MPTVAPPHPPGPAAATGSTRRWPMERVLFLLAGTMTGLGTLLAAVASPWFLLLTGLVAINQLTYVAVGACPASLVLGRLGFTAGCGR